MDSQRPTAEFSILMHPLYIVGEFVSMYGWVIVGAAAAGLLLWHKQLRPVLERWAQAQEDAAYHKDPDRLLERESALQRARQRQQEQLQRLSDKAKEDKTRREEERRAAAVTERTKPTHSPIGYFPLDGGGAGGGYRAPKRSACGGGGCGR